MPETPQQYTERMLSHSRGKDPLRLQQAAPRKFAALIKGLSKKQLSRRPAPGKWSIAEILAHLADAELVIGYRLRLILASNGTTLKTYGEHQERGKETVDHIVMLIAGHDLNHLLQVEKIAKQR